MLTDDPRKPGGPALREPDEEADAIVLDHLQVLEDQYRDDGNPIHAMTAIVFAYDAGISPPVWAMDWLAPAFRQHLESDGKGDLLEVLGTKASGKGKSKPIPQHIDRGNRQTLAFAVHILHVLYGVPISEAAVMAWAREEGAASDPDGKHASWLEEEYRRRYRSEFDKPLWHSFVNQLIREPESRRQFLSSFPENVIPSGLK